MPEHSPYEPAPTLSLDADLIGRLRDDLSTANWTVEVADSFLSPMARAALERDQLVPASTELQGITNPAATLTKLFILAEETNADEVAHAFPSLTIAGAVELGLVRPVGPDPGSSAQPAAEASGPTLDKTGSVSEGAPAAGALTTVRAVMDLRPPRGSVARCSRAHRAPLVGSL
ncbi:hypothetical protein U6G28_01985 [Actinomycetaceae bacterium MB13-C1-2]|nr:hypothetical protein U6G28_01985 [Actinomycetaceae bacterium MB13-C1-2]